jgi:hypothetical protein
MLGHPPPISDPENAIKLIHVENRSEQEKKLFSDVRQITLIKLNQIAGAIVKRLYPDDIIRQLDDEDERRSDQPAVHYLIKSSPCRAVSYSYLVQTLVSMKKHRCGTTILVTNSLLPPQLINNFRYLNGDLRIIDRTQLVKYMFDFNIGVKEEGLYKVKKIDNEFFNS